MDFLRLLAEHRSPAATAVFQAITWFGEELFVVAVLCMLYWCIHKRLAYRICFVYFISGMVVQVLKITFRIDRPWVLDPDFLPVKGAMTTATGYSFPSGHTQAATALFGSCLFLAAGRCWKRRWEKAAACCLCAAAIAAVGMSRMYLGVHTPKDVLVSFAVSIVPAALVGLRRNAPQADGENMPEKSRRLTAAALAAAGLFAAGYALALCSAGILEPKLASDCVKAGGAGVGFALGWYLETGYIRFSCRCRSSVRFALRYLFGIAGTIVLKSGLKAVLGEGMPADAVRYFLTVFWIMALYPVILRRVNRAENRQG